MPIITIQPFQLRGGAGNIRAFPQMTVNSLTEDRVDHLRSHHAKICFANPHYEANTVTRLPFICGIFHQYDAPTRNMTIKTMQQNKQYTLSIDQMFVREDLLAQNQELQAIYGTSDHATGAYILMTGGRSRRQRQPITDPVIAQQVADMRRTARQVRRQIRRGWNPEFGTPDNPD